MINLKNDNNLKKEINTESVKNTLVKVLRFVIENKLLPIMAAIYIFIDKFMPLWQLSAYNHSNADDYWMSVDSHFTWVNTHNIFSMIGQAFNDAIWLRNNWDGCFLSMFLSAFVPVTFHESYYKYTFYIFAITIIIGTVFFMYELCCRLFKMRVCDYILITILALIIIFGFSPSVKEAMYWWCGGINYTFFFGVLLIAQGFLIEYFVSGKLIFSFFAGVLAFCVGLGNLLSALVSPVIMFLELVVLIIIKNKDKAKICAATFLMGLCGLLTNVLAPGNLIRGGEDLFSSSPVIAIWNTIVSSTLLIGEYYKRPMILLLVAMFIVILTGKFTKQKVIASSDIYKFFKWPYLVVILILSYLVYCSAFTPVVYAGNAFYGRCKEISYLFLIFLLVFDMIYLGVFIKLNLRSTISINKYISVISEIILIVVMFFNIVLSNVWGGYFDAAYAKIALETGAAANFHNIMSERFSKYYDPDVSEVEVTTIDWYPGIFYHDDDCLDDIAYYFGKESVKLVE